MPPPADAAARHKAELVMSYHRVRTALGLLGLALPLMLIAGGLATGSGIRPTISDFFHTSLRDIYVGTLCAIGIFLISYRGYRRRPGEWLSDNAISSLAGLAAFALAFFPNARGDEAATLSQLILGASGAERVHFAAGMVFFIALALFCYVQFPKTAQPLRRRIYHACGHAIVVALAVLIAGSWLRNWGPAGLAGMIEDNHLIFWAEALGIWAFALSWLVKGKADLLLSRRRA